MNQLQQASAVLFLLLAASLASSQAAPPPDLDPRPVAPAPPDEIVEPMAQPTPKPDGRITLELRDGSRLFGHPNAWTDFRLTTRFGEVSVEMKEVKGIRFFEPNEKGRMHIAVYFNDGDIVSGNLEAETMELEASWGKSTIAVKEMSSIMNSVKRCVWNWENGWRIRRLDEMQVYSETFSTPEPEGGRWQIHPSPPLVPVLPPAVPGEDHLKAPMPD